MPFIVRGRSWGGRSLARGQRVYSGSTYIYEFKPSLFKHTLTGRSGSRGERESEIETPFGVRSPKQLPDLGHSALCAYGLHNDSLGRCYVGSS